MDNTVEYLYDGIRYIVGECLTKAGYDRTIQGTIVKCVNESIGQYMIKHQDSIFTAYSANVEAKYANNAIVYILIPGNDMTAHKTILGSVKNEGIQGNKVITDSDRYLLYSENLLTLKKTFGLCSYKSNSTKVRFEKINITEFENANPEAYGWYIFDSDQDIYIRTTDAEIVDGRDYYVKISTLTEDNSITIYKNEDMNLIKKEDSSFIIETNNIIINLAGLEKDISANKLVDSLKVGGTFRTDLPEEQQTKGNYGLKFVFLGEQKDTKTIREFILDIDAMTGDPYRYYIGAEQVTYLDISDYTVIGIKEIIFYDEGFPNDADAAENKPNDIFLEGLVLQGCQKLSNEQILATHLRVTHPGGTIFFPQDEDGRVLTTIAEVWENGEAVDEEATGLSYYWFEEDPTSMKYIEGSDELNKDYDVLGGNGWKCLSPYSITAQEHIGDTNIFKLKKRELKTLTKKFKNVAVYNSQKFSKEFTLTNLKANYDFQIITNSGKTTFLKSDISDVKLSINILYREDYTKEWQTFVPSQTDKIVIKWYYEDGWGNYKVPTRVAVDNSYIYISLADFNQNLKILCSILINDEIYGATDIILTKVNSLDGPYTLSIVNNNPIFVYDEEGISPTNEKNKNPLLIQPLDFQIFDNINNIIVDSSKIPEEEIIWYFPLPEESLLNLPSGAVFSEENNKYYLKGHTMSFSLDDNYNYLQNANNTILLNVNYYGIVLSASTKINCIKQGDNGTNGTGYNIKIAPILEKDGGPWSNESLYFPIVQLYKEENENYLKTRKDYNKPWFNVELWFEGTKIFSGFSTGLIEKEEMLDESDNTVYINWEFKKHKDNTWNIEDSLYEVTEDGVFSIKDNIPDIDFRNIENQNFCHLLQVTVNYKNQTISAIQPIGTMIAHYNDNIANRLWKDDIYLKNNTGFTSVRYNADGSSPHYSKIYPFTLVEKESVNGENQVIKDVTLENIAWSAAGVYKETKNGDFISSNNLKIPSVLVGEMQLTPSDLYNGFCLTNAAIGTSTDETIQVHLPIDFYLNRYANKAINGWDGNSININEDDGIILSPQIGAGRKEDDNSFTGVIMGLSKTKEKEDTKNEVGIFAFNHGKRTVFIDSENGHAHFGISSEGSIDIEPALNKYGEVVGQPMIQSGNYNFSKKDGKGLSIGFGQLPYIKYGNGTFQVDENGALTANGATITGKFISQNLNSWDQSRILIGAETESETSEILLYNYETVSNNIIEEQKDRYIIAKTHLAPGILDLSLYRKEDYSAPVDTTKKNPYGLPQAYSYLRFEDDEREDGQKEGQLKLKGNFESETDNTKVIFSSNSKRTQIYFRGTEKREDYLPIADLEIDLAKNKEYQKNLIQQAIDIISLENLGDMTGFSSDDEIVAEIKKWGNSIGQNADGTYGYISKYLQIQLEISTILEELEYINKLTEDINTKIEVIKQEIEGYKDVNKENYKNRDEYLKLQKKNGRVESDIIYDVLYRQYTYDINSNNQKIEELNNQIQAENGLLKDQEENRKEILNKKEELRTLLREIKATIYTKDEIKNLDSEILDQLYYFEDLIFNKTIIENKTKILAQKYNVAIKYLEIEKDILNITRQITREKLNGNSPYKIKSEFKITPKDFKLISYEDANGELGYIPGEAHYTRSKLEYNSEKGYFEYVGSLDFSAEPYAELKLTRESATKDGLPDPTKNGSFLYFKTFFPLNEIEYKPDKKAVHSSIELKPGYFSLQSRQHKDDNFSYIRMKDGRMTMKDIDFSLKTFCSDVAFKKESKRTHIIMHNYKPDEDDSEIVNKIGFVKITPSIFQIKANDSSLYVNPENESLTYSGNVSMSNSHGVFYMEGASMALRFGTTVEDYGEQYKDFNSGLKVTDLSISPTGFSIKAYGPIDKGAEIEDCSDFYNQTEDAVSLFNNSTTGYYNDQGAYNQNSFNNYFNREFIPEDNVKYPDGVTSEEEFLERYRNYFYTPVSDDEAQLKEDFDVNSIEELQNKINGVDNEGQPKIAVGYDYVPTDEEGTGDYDLVENANGDIVPQYVGTGGNYRREIYNDSVELSTKTLPQFLTGSSSGINTEGKQWGQISGLTYNSRSKKFRLNGDFTLKNEHGSVIFNDDMMRIMFKTTELVGEEEMPKTRMCIAEDSFYFYSFGYVLSEDQIELRASEDHKLLFASYKNRYETPRRGITGGIIWRDGVLTIIGSIYADSGKIGGWTVSDNVIASALGSAVLNGQEGSLFLSKGVTTADGGTCPGTIRSEFANRRASMRLGDFLIEGIENSILIKEFNRFKEIIITEWKIVKDAYKDAERKKLPKRQIVAETIEEFYSSVKKRGLIIDSAIEAEKDEDLVEVCLNYNEQINNAIDTLFAVIKTESADNDAGLLSRSSWVNYAHVYGGYDASNGLVLTTEGESNVGMHYRLDKNDTLILDDSNLALEATNEKIAKGIYFGLSYDREYLEDKILSGGEEELTQEFIDVSVESPVIAILPTVIPDSAYSLNENSSLNNNEYIPIKDIKIPTSQEDSKSISKNPGSINFILGIFKHQEKEENEDEENTEIEKAIPQYSYNFGTQIMPHLIKSKDLYLNNSELQSEKYPYYHSNSLVDILKEIRTTPKSISYIDSEEAYDNTGIIGNYDFSSGNTALIVEEWDYPSVKNYTVNRSVQINEEKESISEQRIWKLTLKTVEDSDDKEVEKIELIGTDVSIDLSGFIVNLY